MATPVILPRQGQSVESCIITEILIKKGDEVKEGDLLLRYETDKAVFELEAPEAGTVLAILPAEGDEVVVLENLLILGKPGEDISEFKTQDQGQKTQDPGSPISPGQASPGQAPDLKTEDAGIKTGEDGKLKISPRAKRMAHKLAIPVQNIMGTGPGGRIIEREG